MGALVFNDEGARRRLEAIVHPLVFERIVELEGQAPPDARRRTRHPAAGRERAGQDTSTRSSS